ncbi:hypothetical protein PHYBOEH_010406 [Phytophthora boehmeriae]|uniref:FYVE-type domain-containing protein n=1 Tax=Phytophthora boehmeriae TaxID=109152 RepID=A0A8T1VRK2_9STRA|nr:hypothetical protein PHYBOEH_010406 [Phytophthora boehmeriae]
MWDCKDISGFALLSRRSGTSGENFEVLTTGEVACRPCDIEPLLHPQTESDYNAVAQGFLGDQFIYGSVVHDVHPRGFGVDSALNTYCDDDSVDLDDDDFIAVKTASFARSRRFTRNEEWCFIEHFQSNPATPSSPFGSNASSTPSSVSLDDSPGFTIVMSSIPDGELSAGKMADGQVVQLHGILAAYLVEPLPQTVGCQGPRVRVSFHATFNAAEPNRERYADSQTVRERLLSIARSLHRLPELVQKRQCQRSQMSLGGGEVGQERETPNSRCIACTKRLRMRLLSAPTRRSKRCQMCLYRACASCWSKEKVSTFNGHSTTMAVCRRCHENIGSRDFSHIHLTC